MGKQRQEVGHAHVSAAVEIGVPAVFDGGDVGVTDFLVLLGNWGPCP